MPSFSEYFLILPFLTLGSGILISVLIDSFLKNRNKIAPYFSILNYLVSGILFLYLMDKGNSAFNKAVAVGGNIYLMSAVICFAAIISVLGSIEYLKKYGSNFSEYFSLLEIAVFGMTLMASARDLLVVFIGLEIMSVCFYVLAGISRAKASNNEASLKYFLLGAFATGFIVYGIALIFGTAQTTSIIQIFEKFPLLSKNLVFLIGSMIFIIGFSFKIAVFPFHMWVPDVYQGAATSVTGFMSTLGKSSAFMVLLAFLATFFTGRIHNTFQIFFAVVATLSMLYGSIVGIAQKNIKRMLAYSSIAHAGYMAVGLSTSNSIASAGILYYLTAYIFMNLGAFIIISVVEGENETNLAIDAYKGLSNKSPFLAAMMAFFMFALSGIPPMAGFFGKYYIILAAIQDGSVWLSILLVLSSAISAYFYLRIIILMYFREVDDNFNVTFDIKSKIAVLLSALPVLFFGLFPNVLMGIVLSFLK